MKSPTDGLTTIEQRVFDAVAGSGVQAPPTLAQIQQAAVLALALAQQGVADAANARQMVLNRDPTLTQLGQAAAQLPLTQASAALEHQAIRDLITALTARVTALEPRAVTVQQQRVAATSLLALGQTVDLVVTWATPFADTNYIVIPLLDSTGGLVNVQPPVEKAGTRTKTSVTVSVKTNAILAGGITLNVVGLQFG